ncbi:MAG TPA: hypothetical protein VKA91_10050, partial [Nitrososphaeraceae archaeon]|nr:hypothetical protein [Nitrososphaeraceae archaeon]
ATHENHWAARAIKHKQAILNNEELSDFCTKKYHLCIFQSSFILSGTTRRVIASLLFNDDY